MKAITKITSMRFSKLNNAEYTNFATRFHSLATTAGPESLGLEEGDTDLDDYAALLGQMNDLVAQSRTAAQTAGLEELDRERDNLVSYLLALIRNAKSSPVAGESKAAATLYALTKPYTGIQQLANQQETVQIKGLLIDLSKPEYAEAVAALRLSATMELLANANDEYAALTEERAAARLASQTDNSKTVRARMDELYDYLSTMGFVQSVARPTEKTAQFVASLNALIGEVDTLYNQRMAQAGKGAKKKARTDGGE